MKKRWIGGLVLATAVVLGACAPPNQGGQPSTPADSAAPESVAPESVAPASVEPAESTAPESQAPSPTPYDY